MPDPNNRKERLDAALSYLPPGEWSVDGEDIVRREMAAIGQEVYARPESVAAVVAEARFISEQAREYASAGDWPAFHQCMGILILLRQTLVICHADGAPVQAIIDETLAGVDIYLAFLTIGNRGRLDADAPPPQVPSRPGLF